jgi:hypothetical protein
MEEAERGNGWVAWCCDRELYIACTRELLNALERIMRRLPGIILEVGAGCGDLAFELSRCGVPVVATDPAPADHRVAALNARDALAIYQPQTVLSTFLPVDAGLEREIMQCSTVLSYVYIGPLIMGRVGPEALWRSAEWMATPLPEVDAALISRLDVLPDFTRRTHQRGAGAVLLERI